MIRKGSQLVLLDMENNVDVYDYSRPVAAAELLRRYLLDQWPTREEEQRQMKEAAAAAAAAAAAEKAQATVLPPAPPGSSHQGRERGLMMHQANSSHVSPPLPLRASADV
jgi:hypothetical protein